MVRVPKSKDYKFSIAIRNADVSDNLFMVIFVSLICLAEGGLFGYNGYYKLIEFYEKPKYEVLVNKRIIHSDFGMPEETITNKTVVKSGSDKYCGEYGSDADDLVNFINDLPVNLLMIFYSSFVLISIIQLFLEIGTRLYKYIDKKKYTKVESISTERNPSQNRNQESYSKGLSKDIGVLINFIFPFYKLICFAILYPITYFTYGDCLETGNDLLTNPKFLKFVIFAGYFMTCGLLALGVFFCVNKNFIRVLIGIPLCVASFGLCLYWVIGSCITYWVFSGNNHVSSSGSSKNSGDSSCVCLYLAICFFSGIFLLTITFPILFNLFALLGLPYFTFNLLTIGISVSLFLRLFIVRIMDKCLK